MQFLLNIYLKLYQFYDYLRTLFLNLFGPLYFIYYFKNNKFTNITLNFYFNIGLYQYIHGVYFCKAIHPDQTHHLIYCGSLDQIEEIDFEAETDVDITRKNILLYKDDTVLSCDLKVLDNYVYNMKKFKKDHVINPKILLPHLGYDCTHIHLQQLRPFKKEVFDIELVDLDNLHIVKLNSNL